MIEIQNTIANDRSLGNDRQPSVVSRNAKVALPKTFAEPPAKLEDHAIPDRYDCSKSDEPVRRDRVAQRRGAVAVEFAMVIPILFLFFFAAFEFCRVAMIRHTVDNAVYEAARRGIIPGATSSEVRAEANRVLGTIGLTSFDIHVRPTNIRDDTDEVTVTIEVPLDENTYVPATYFIGKEFTRELTMRREGR